MVLRESVAGCGEKKRTLVGAVSSLIFMVTKRLYRNREKESRKKRVAGNNTQ